MVYMVFPQPVVTLRTHSHLACSTGIFWIATAWLAAGLYIAPFISGRELAGQRLGVNILFGALLLVVLGSMTGEWLSISNRLSGDAWFYFGHQGYEYIDLGRGLADSPGSWISLVGISGRKKYLSGPPTERRTKNPFGTISGFHSCHRGFLCRRFDVGKTYQSGHRRILALVGGPSMGGRIFSKCLPQW